VVSASSILRAAWVPDDDPERDWEIAADLAVVTTPRASRDRVGRGKGPVLAYVPDEKALNFAAGLARGSSLAIVESIHGFPLKGWVRQLGAIDLTRSDEQPEQIDSELAEAIDRLDFYKNNGFGDQFGKQQAQRILQDLRGSGLLERDVVLGALAAKGASDRAVRNLGKLIDALDRG
jgi:hypothetical protein